MTPTPHHNQKTVEKPYPFIFSNPHPWKADQAVDADKQINMYYVNNVEIHA